MYLRRSWERFTAPEAASSAGQVILPSGLLPPVAAYTTRVMAFIIELSIKMVARVAYECLKPLETFFAFFRRTSSLDAMRTVQVTSNTVAVIIPACDMPHDTTKVVKIV